METIIIICLILIIVLLLQDKVVIHKPKNKDPDQLSDKDQDSIMGIPKVVERTPDPKRTHQGPQKTSTPEMRDFDNVAEEKEIDIPFPDEVPEGIADDLPNPFEQWETFEYPEIHNDFSAGVTYDEINTVVKVLKQPELPDGPLQQETIKVVEKMKDSQLLLLLENSFAGASVKIAELLDRNLPQKTEPPIKRKKNDLDGFDIEEFV